MERNHSIDILRFVGVFLVVMVHSTYFCRDVVAILPKLAVPMFFMISGFCSYTENGQNLLGRLRRSASRMVYLLLASSLLFFIFYLPLYLRDGFPPLSSWLDFILFNEHPFGFHLWYVAAYLYVVLIYWGLSRYSFFSSMVKIMPFLLLINLLFGEFGFLFYDGVISHNFWIRNFLFEALPLYSVGFLLAQYKDKIRMSGYMFSSSFMFMIAFSLIEYYRIKKMVGIDVAEMVDVYIGPILLAFILVIWAIQPRRVGNIGESIAKWGRRYSLPIYIFHVIFLVTFRSLFKSSNSYELYALYMEPLVVFCTTWCFSVVWYYVKGKLPILNRL